jgi:hypothetical protein
MYFTKIYEINIPFLLTDIAFIDLVISLKKYARKVVL